MDLLEHSSSIKKKLDKTQRFEAKQKLIPPAFIIAYVYYFFHEGRESKWSLEL